jgi:hypothetical protein
MIFYDCGLCLIFGPVYAQVLGVDGWVCVSSCI